MSGNPTLAEQNLQLPSFGVQYAFARGSQHNWRQGTAYRNYMSFIPHTWHTVEHYTIYLCVLLEFQLLVRKIRSRLALIYRALGDEDQCNTHLRLADQTNAALGLTCGACGNVFGLQPASLEALPCAHILHSR